MSLKGALRPCDEASSFVSTRQRRNLDDLGKQKKKMKLKLRYNKTSPEIHCVRTNRAGGGLGSGLVWEGLFREVTKPPEQTGA